MNRFFVTTILAAIAAATAQASFTINTDFGYLKNNNGSAFEPVGGLLLLITDTNTGQGDFGLSLSAGQYVTGNDAVLDAFAMNYSITTGEDGSALSIPYGGLVQNDELALRWFPGITYANYETALTGGTAAALLTAGQYYGTYSTTASLPVDGGNAWLIPADGSNINLVFNTTDDGGNEAPSAGYASSQIPAVPEPATLSLMAGAVAVGAMALRRRK